MSRRLARTYATHVKTPLLLPLGPPAPPAPPAKPAPKAASSSSSSAQSPKSTAQKVGAPSTLPKPRLDYPALLNNPASTTSNHLSRKAPVPYGSDTVAHLKRLRDTQLLLLQKLESIRAKQKDVGELIRHGLSDREDALRQAKKLKTKAGEYESNLGETETELLEIGLSLPNFSSTHTPLGPESEAVEVERFGPEPIAADPHRDHLGVAQYWDLVDNEASTTTTGGSWPYLKSTLALLEQCLISYALSIAIKHGFTPVLPPDVVKRDIAWRCGFLPRDDVNGPSQVYGINTEEGAPELCLAGTAEIPLAGLFANRVLEGDMPKRVVGVGRAFRAEAGARGADTRGLYRVHQFTKVELFTVARADEGQGEGEMDLMRTVQREIAQGLGLSVRVLEMPTEELGASAARKWDMEAWMPGRGKWGEITSTSNCTDFQSRRLHIRYRPTTPSDSSGLPFAHTLNGTAAAIPRLLVALLENGVRFSEDGKTPKGLELPKALERFWIGGSRVGEGKPGEITWV